jgi:hypothetical protein
MTKSIRPQEGYGVKDPRSETKSLEKNPTTGLVVERNYGSGMKMLGSTFPMQGRSGSATLALDTSGRSRIHRKQPKLSGTS